LIAADEIDRLLLSFCAEHYLKVARIIGKTMDALEVYGTTEVAAQIEARLEVLVRTGQLEADGNIRRWRFSEVRLPQKAPP
jgi:hypothetical protein